VKTINTTDPESKVMSSATGYLQGYNAQSVANEDDDGRERLLVGGH